MLTPYTLLSFKDMFDLPIGTLLFTYTRIANLAQAVASLPPDRHLVLPARDYADFSKVAEDFLAASRAIGLKVTEVSASRLPGELKHAEEQGGNFHFRGANLVHLTGCLNEIVICMQNESALKVALMLPPDKEEYFEPKAPLFGDEVHAKFNNVIYEISEAAKCLALGRSTASVFHLMRILEIALRAIHSCLGIEVALTGNERNWGNILARIREETAKRGNGWAEKTYFKEIYARLDAVKDAWRNNTMHVESIYTEQEAKILFDNTRALMQKIASRMDEHGLPLA
ncbi:hypothetical protein [Candidatus Ferrigenium straubiae]|jgi:hypothetical protein|uniref:hypothetical protein n=1 Tax=Candidatus Ferrigenium straubiae TaxID=2919506 RepID=UPI003F4AF0E4